MEEELTCVILELNEPDDDGTEGYLKFGGAAWTTARLLRDTLENDWFKPGQLRVTETRRHRKRAQFFVSVTR